MLFLKEIRSMKSIVSLLKKDRIVTLYIWKNHERNRVFISDSDSESSCDKHDQEVENGKRNI